MKKLLTSALLSCFVFCASAQITLEQTYPTGGSNTKSLRIVSLTIGTKYYTFDTTSNTIMVYNMNHSVYRTINVPPQVGSYNWYVHYLSDKLFDTDSTDFDYIILTSFISPNYTNINIYNENGSLIFSKDSATLGSSLTSVHNPAIFNTDSGTKMILFANQSFPPATWAKVYSLPGTLPCGACGNAFGPLVGDNGEFMNNENKLPNPYPNPTDNTTTIPYTLPEGESTGEIVFYDVTGKEIKRFKVDKTFSQILISSADLAPGTYYYHLQTAKNTSQGKTLVVIK